VAKLDVDATKPQKIELIPYPDNPREISQEAFELLGESMKEFGDLSGIVLNGLDGFLISGHQRVSSLIERYGKYDIYITEALPEQHEKRGFVEPEHIQFRLVHWDEGKAGLARLAANKHGGGWDDEKLDLEILKLQEMNVDIKLSGFENLNVDDNFGEEFELADGEKEPFQEMNFVLADEQAETIKNALRLAKQEPDFESLETHDNENSNGNALYYIVTEWVEQRK